MSPHSPLQCCCAKPIASNSRQGISVLAGFENASLIAMAEKTGLIAYYQSL